MNAVQLIGRLTKDIELKQTQSGIPFATFTLAVNRDFKNQNGEYEADFILCQVWRKQAEIMAQYLGKGLRVGIEGQIRTRNYENQQGQRVYVTEVVVDKFHFLDSRKDNQQQYGSQQYNQTPQQQSYNQAPQQQQSYNQTPQNQQPNNQAPQQQQFDAMPMEVDPDDLPF